MLKGLLISLFVVVLQFWPDWSLIPVVLAIFIVGQGIADYVLAPYLIAERIHLIAVEVMFAIAAFGYLFGFVGLLIAVPKHVILLRMSAVPIGIKSEHSDGVTRRELGSHGYAQRPEWSWYRNRKTDKRSRAAPAPGTPGPRADEERRRFYRKQPRRARR
jgi:hypothetical protein